MSKYIRLTLTIHGRIRPVVLKNKDELKQVLNAISPSLVEVPDWSLTVESVGMTEEEYKLQSTPSTSSLMETIGESAHDL